MRLKSSCLETGFPEKYLSFQLFSAIFISGGFLPWFCTLSILILPMKNLNLNFKAMKTIIKIIIIVSLSTFIVFPQLCRSQDWGGEKPTALFSKWSINFSGGFTSYFGDLSLHDLDIGAKLTRESGNAFSIIVTKNIWGDAFGLSGQILTGKLEGRKQNISFKADLFEYNLHARIDFLEIISRQKSKPFGLVGYAGVGQFLFKTRKVIVDEGIVRNFIHDDRTPEFVFFFGGGIYYKIKESFSITADVALRQCQNDRLDDYVKNNDFDYYSYISIGISYHIETFKRKPLKNKARLANSNFLFSSPPQ